MAVLVPAAIDPVSLDELKQFAKIDGEDEDALLDSFIGAATQAAENYTRRSFITQTRRLSVSLPRSRSLDSLEAGVYDLPVTFAYASIPTSIYLPCGPVQSVASVITYGLDNQPSAYPPANYSLDVAQSRIYPNSGASWPSSLRPMDACHIDYVAGYGDEPDAVPKPIRQAILIHAAALYETRGMCGCDLPSASRMMLDPYRIYSL